jgi:hypothetical protein
MSHTLRRGFAGAALIALVPSTAAIVIAAGQHEHPATGEHRHREAENLKNPVAADATSFAAVNYRRSIGPAKSH